MEMYGPSMQKRFNPGPAARNGVTAARMAQLGFTGADTIFEGERGFLKAFTDETQPEALGGGPEGPYELLIEFKPYSCARPIHNAIDCALEVRGKAGFDAEDVRTHRVRASSGLGALPPEQDARAPITRRRSRCRSRSRSR